MLELNSKGSLTDSAAVQMVIGFIVVGTVVIMFLNSINFIGTAGGEQQDRDQIIKLYEEIEAKCEDLTTAEPSVVSTGHRINLRTYDTIRYDGSSGEIVAEKPDDVLRLQLTGCNYDFEGFPVQKEESTVWNFEIGKSDQQTYPPTVVVSTGDALSQE